ncbi:flippase-like domain-containing protein [Parabacteroides sp. OttesenSCG-928-N08]|nr:flippase-like domain-containing protein [Parabacteroides sp. OttesenSCG-928-N08]
MDISKILRTSAKILIPLAFGGLLLWYLYRDLDLSAIWTVVRKGVRYDIILLSLLFGLFANIIRGLRWKLLIDSTGEKVKTSNAIYAVLGNYAVNLVLPRVGEVWRCGIVSKYDKISFTKLFGTLLIDRVCDTLMVGLLTFFIFIFNFGFFKSFFAKNPALLDGFQSMFNSIWIYVAVILIGAGIWFVFTYMKQFTLVQKARNMLNNVWAGIKSIWLLERKGLFILYTFLIWGGYFLYFYITFFAFDFTSDLGIVVGLIAFAMSSIGVAVPVQGGIGPWHFMVIATLVNFSVGETDAAAFALVVHTLQQTIWTALCGLFAIVALPLTNKKVDSELPAADIA